MGKAGLNGKKFTATFASTGAPSFFLYPGEAFHGDLEIPTPSDVVILISYSGETGSHKAHPKPQGFWQSYYCHGRKRQLVFNAKFGHFSRCVGRERGLSQQFGAYHFDACHDGDALALALIKGRAFQSKDFTRFHPSGNLGRHLLTRVRDMMRTNLPSVTPDATVCESLFTMTSERMD